MRKWIARFSFTFMILGGVLLYEAYEQQAAKTPMWQVLVMVVGGALAIALGLQGVRIRHEQMRNE